MPGRVRFAAGIASLLVGSAAGCASVPKLAYSPAELRATLAHRAPAISPGEIVVPYEITGPETAIARDLVREAHSDVEKVRILVAAIFDPDVFGLRYASTGTATADETLRRSEGNCLALASVFIGLARAVGLDARYMDASVRVHETRDVDEETTVHFGHVTAMVVTGNDGNVGLDFARLGPIRWYRIIDDLEALAHFYNNRGYEVIDLARERGEPTDWAAAGHEFELAVQVKPTLALAWNNLGLAAAHLGRSEEAIRDYRRAIAIDPNLPAPRTNLGALYLRSGDPAAALAPLEAAARLDPGGAHAQYNLAVARLPLGDRAGAVKALERAVALRRGYRSAQTLLDELRLSPVGVRDGPPESAGVHP
jgi:hypothetical protein